MNLKSFLKEYVVDTGSEGKHETPPAQNAPAPVSSGIPGISGIPGLSTTAAPVTAPVAATPPHFTAAVDPTAVTGMVEKLRNKYANSPLYSFVQQFNLALESLSDAIPEEGNRFRAALKLLQKQSGVDNLKLTEAYTSLLSVLDGEAAKFGKALEATKMNEIDARDSMVHQINTQIEAKNKEIQALMEQRDAVAIEITTQKTKLGAAQANFEGAVATLRSEITDATNKLKIYLPASIPATK